MTRMSHNESRNRTKPRGRAGRHGRRPRTKRAAPRRRQLTVRLEPELSRAIEDQARSERISLNEAALRLLRRATGAGAPGGAALGAVGHSLDGFAGTWTKDEAADFDRRVDEMFGQIDEELWR